MTAKDRTTIDGVWIWRWRSQDVRIYHRKRGSGPEVLFLPAFSTVSSVEELEPLANLISVGYTCILVDWPGFGDSDRDKSLTTNELFREFTGWLLDRVDPDAVVAAGHGTGYVLDELASDSMSTGPVVLLSPTWRGPLPTVMGQHPTLYSLIRWVGSLPVIGHLLYRANTSRRFIGFMYRRHVFANTDFADRGLLKRRQAIARGSSSARFAPIAFVTGALDPASSRREHLDNLAEVSSSRQTLLVKGTDTPSRSATEMDAMCQIGEVQCVDVPGALGCYEEHAHVVAQHVKLFLDTNLK